VLVAEGVRAAHLWERGRARRGGHLHARQGAEGVELHTRGAFLLVPRTLAKKYALPARTSPGWGACLAAGLLAASAPSRREQPTCDEGGNQHAIGDAIRGHPEARCSRRE
jgi:hypothetical protein